MRADGGSGSVVAVGVAAGGLVSVLALAGLVAATTARAGAQAVADGAALPGATEARDERALAGVDMGERAEPGRRAATRAGCAVAAATAGRSGGTVVRCTADDAGVVDVVVSVGRAEVGARAGPRQADGGPG